MASSWPYKDAQRRQSVRSNAQCCCGPGSAQAGDDHLLRLLRIRRSRRQALESLASDLDCRSLAKPESWTHPFGTGTFSGHRAPVRFVPVRIAPVRSARVKSASVRSAPLRSAFTSLASVNFVPLWTTAPRRSAETRRTRVRSAPNMRAPGRTAAVRSICGHTHVPAPDDGQGCLNVGARECVRPRR